MTVQQDRNIKVPFLLTIVSTVLILFSMLFLGSNTVSASTTQPKDQELYSQLDDTTKSQLAELDKYLVDVDGIKFFDYDKAESSGASDAILTMGADSLLIKKYTIKSVPTLVRFKRGQAIRKQVGQINDLTLRELMKNEE